MLFASFIEQDRKYITFYPIFNTQSYNNTVYVKKFQDQVSYVYSKTSRIMKLSSDSPDVSSIIFLDTLSAVKLYLAFLQYPAVEFYGLSQDDNQNRLSLIALAWLLGTQDALTIALRTKLANSVLGTEFSHADPSEVSLQIFRIKCSFVKYEISILHWHSLGNLWSNEACYRDNSLMFFTFTSQTEKSSFQSFFDRIHKI